MAKRKALGLRRWRVAHAASSAISENSIILRSQLAIATNARVAAQLSALRYRAQRKANISWHALA